MRPPKDGIADGSTPPPVAVARSTRRPDTLLEHRGGGVVPQFWQNETPMKSAEELAAEEAAVIEWELDYVLRMPSPPSLLAPLFCGLQLVLQPTMSEPNWVTLQELAKDRSALLQRLTKGPLLEGDTLQKVAQVTASIRVGDFDGSRGAGARCAPWLHSQLVRLTTVVAHDKVVGASESIV